MFLKEQQVVVGMPRVSGTYLVHIENYIWFHLVIINKNKNSIMAFLVFKLLNN